MFSVYVGLFDDLSWQEIILRIMSLVKGPIVSLRPVMNYIYEWIINKKDPNTFSHLFTFC